MRAYCTLLNCKRMCKPPQGRSRQGSMGPPANPGLAEFSFLAALEDVQRIWGVYGMALQVATALHACPLPACMVRCARATPSLNMNSTAACAHA